MPKDSMNILPVEDSQPFEFLGQTINNEDFVKLIAEGKFLSKDPKVTLIAKITWYLDEGETESLDSEERRILIDN